MLFDILYHLNWGSEEFDVIKRIKRVKCPPEAADHKKSWVWYIRFKSKFEPPHDKTNKMACAPSKDRSAWASAQSDHLGIRPVWSPGHLPSLIRVFAVCIREAWVVSYPLSTQQRLWSDWEDAQADLSLCWAHVILLVLSCGSFVYS